MHLLALARQDRRVDRLGQQRVAEAEAARRLVGDEHAVLDRRAQRLAHVALRQRRRGAQQRVGDVAPGCCGQAQQVLRRAGRARPSAPAAARAGCAGARVPVAGGGEELLGEERVALGTRDDRGRDRRRRGSVGARREQLRQLLVAERSELEQQRRARAPHAIGEPAHALGRRGLVGAVGRQQQDPPIVEVVREEDDEIERRRVSPVQVLEHE